MTKPAPARLIGYFAKSAPVCIILRRGPSRYILMIKWHTDTDVFEVGQWILGRVEELTMTKTGSHAAFNVYGGKFKQLNQAPNHGQYSVVCRPPFFTALLVKGVINGSVGFTFTADDRLFDLNLKVPGNETIERAQDWCPFHKALKIETLLRPQDDLRKIDATQGPAKGTDQSGREILFDSGKIFAIENGEPRLLFDTNPLKFTQVEPPAWALTWNEIPESSP